MLAVLFSLMTLGGDRGIVGLFCFLFPVFLPSQITSCKLLSSACHVLLFLLLLLISFRICVIFCLSCSAFPRWQDITSASLLRCHCSISPAVGGLIHGGLIKYSQCGEAEGERAVSDSSVALGARSKRSHLRGAFSSWSNGVICLSLVVQWVSLQSGQWEGQAMKWMCVG